MERRDFIQKTSLAGLAAMSLPVVDLFAQHQSDQSVKMKNHLSIDPSLMRELEELLQEISQVGWNDFLTKELSIDIDLRSINDLSSLSQPLNDVDSITSVHGAEDFGGNKLIEPGSPSLSLLYHLLASPRVVSKHIASYPTLRQLDVLENYIYAFVDVEKSTFVNSDHSNVQLAVLSYEYRPAYKVPPMDNWKRNGNEFAKMVYSRSGIARTGATEANYDRQKRCFTNLPGDSEQEKNVAVMPARYGLFVVELVDVNQHPSFDLMNQQSDESTNLGKRYFINPIKKLGNTDDITIAFGHYHKNEKLKKLAEYEYGGVSFRFDHGVDLHRPPFTRISATTDSQKELTYYESDKSMVTLHRLGQSALISPVANDLIREAKQDDQLVTFQTPESWSEKGHANRRYAALKLPNEDGHEITNVIISDVFGRRERRTTSFKAPKVAPLFANIKFEVDASNNEVRHLDGQTEKDFESKICKGNYSAVLFEDSICDGCVSAQVVLGAGITNVLKEIYKKPVLPAFSLVTAPDFFPFIDSNDLRTYYQQTKPKVNVDEDFFEGGSLNLSGIRQRGNPNVKEPFTMLPAFADSKRDDKSFDTLTAVIGSAARTNRERSYEDKVYNYQKDYLATSHLPDTGTGVFFPGWDVTYSGAQENPFLATFGLGSPFPEDMKLCAAANGMWPVTSPDAGRTFQGSLEKLVGKRPNTAIPLMDKEIGLNQHSPHVKYHQESAGYGWDGEQGPFLDYHKGSLMVNYTDIERADYLQNLLDPAIGFDMSQLRNLKTEELIHRMDCLRSCVRKIDHKKVWKTNLWLVGAEKIDDWSKNQQIKSLPNHKLFSQLKADVRQNPKLKGEGYLYVFVLSKNNKKEFKGILDEKDEAKKRRLLDVKTLWVCQVNRNYLAYTKIKQGSTKPRKWVTKSLK